LTSRRLRVLRACRSGRWVRECGAVSGAGRGEGAWLGAWRRGAPPARLRAACSTSRRPRVLRACRSGRWVREPGATSW